MAYGPSPIKRDSVISQAAQEICRIIEAERLAPGDTLPPETRLSQMLGISRNSVREALRVLHGLGYVEKAAGRRVVVTAGAQGGKSMFDESVLLEAAPIANQVRSHIAQKCAELVGRAHDRRRIDRARRRARRARTGDRARRIWQPPRPRTMRSTGCCWRAPGIRCWSRCSTRRRWRGSQTSRPSTRASTIRAILRITARLLRALRKRDARAASAVVRKHFQSLGLMLEFVTQSRRKPAARVLALVPPSARRGGRRVARMSARGHGAVTFGAERIFSPTAPLPTLPPRLLRARAQPLDLHLRQERHQRVRAHLHDRRHVELDQRLALIRRQLELVGDRPAHRPRIARACRRRGRARAAPRSAPPARA